jgi:hypothetical protein
VSILFISPVTDLETLHLLLGCRNADLHLLLRVQECCDLHGGMGYSLICLRSPDLTTIFNFPVSICSSSIIFSIVLNFGLFDYSCVCFLFTSLVVEKTLPPLSLRYFFLFSQ